jgi:hypothetical protein
MNHSQMDSLAAAAPSIAAKSSPAAVEPSTIAKSSPVVVAKSSPTPAPKVVQPAAPIPIVVDDVMSPSLTTSGCASHTPSFFDNSITSMDVKDVEHETGDVHRSSVRDTGSMGHGSHGSWGLSTTI